MLQVTHAIAIDEGELVENFVRASGPGGQNVNNVATAVELRFHVDRSETLPGPVKVRLKRAAGRRLSQDGWLVIRAERFRSQERNRADARQRLAALIAEAARPPRRRIKTRPTLASKRRRIEAKKRRGDIKRTRSGKPSLE